MSVTGAAPFPIVDDKLITILDSNTTYTWIGGDAGFETSWNRAANWSPAGIPNTATENAVIPDTANDPVLDVTGITINNLTINSSASVDFNGQNININGTFSNDGILYLQGNETTNIGAAMDTDSGTVEYTGQAGVICSCRTRGRQQLL